MKTFLFLIKPFSQQLNIMTNVPIIKIILFKNDLILNNYYVNFLTYLLRVMYILITNFILMQ